MMSDTIIFHVDVNSAFLSWEAAYRIKILEDTLDLRDIPSAIGGDIEKPNYALYVSFKYDKYEKLDKAIDEIRGKYGEDSIMSAPFLSSKLDHMSGGRYRYRIGL